MESYRRHTANLEAETAAVPMVRPATLLGRSRDEDDDLIRTERARLRQLINNLAEAETETVRAQRRIVAREVLNNYMSLLRARYLMREEHAYLSREAEAPEMGRRFSSTPRETDEESARSRGKRHEEMVLQQLKIRNIDKEEERHDDEEEEICSVCLDDLYRGTVAALDCRHEFHVGCIKRWIVGGKNFCPLCRATALPALD